MMGIVYRKQAVKYINSLDSQTKQRIKDGILGLTCHPPQGDIKLLRGIRDGSRRLRVGGYRIIYRVEKDEITIDKIDSRGGIYK